MKLWDEVVVDSVSEGSYYLSEQAADFLRSGAMNVAHLTEQRKSLSGKQLMSLVLKRSLKWTPVLVRPHACLSVTSPPLPGGCPLPSSGLLSPTVTLCEPPLFDDPGLLSEKSFQAGRVRTALWWGPRHVPALLTCRGSFEEPEPVPVRPPTHTSTHPSRWSEEDRGLAYSIENPLLWLSSSLSDGFNEGIWILLSSCA